MSQKPCGNPTSATPVPFQAPFAPWPFFEDDEIEAAVNVLRSGKVNYWTGQEGRQFEEEYAASTGTRHAIALSNGTAALELALYALNIGPGDEVVVPCRTFIASASCVVARGARPVICDVDRETQTLTRDTVQAVLTRRTRAIIAVHLAGWPCDMHSLRELARERNLFIIEDCAQAHGAEYHGQPVGSWGDVGCFSFCQDKILTTAGEGGLLVTNNTELWDRAWRFKDHGKTPAAFYQPAPPSSQFRWLHESFGTNFRMTEVQAAMGRVILKKLPEWVRKRRSHAAALMRTCQEISALRTSAPPSHIHHAYYKFYTFVRPEMLQSGWTRDRIIESIRAEGIPCFSGSCSEIYLEQAFPQEWRPTQPLAVGRELGETSLMFLVHPTLNDIHISATQRALSKVFEAATKSSASNRRAEAA